MANSRPRSSPSAPAFPAPRFASQRHLFVAGIPRRVLHRFSARCGVLMLHANRSGALGRHEKPTSRKLDRASRRSGRVRPHPRAHPDHAARARARPRPHWRLDLSRHRLGRVLLTITLAPQASAAAAPQGCSRRRLPPTLAPRASCAAGSRGCSRPTAALAVGLRRGHALLCSPRVPAPRASAAACPGLLAPQTPASRFLRRRHAGLTAAHRAATLLAARRLVWLMPSHPPLMSRCPCAVEVTLLECVELQ